jgi:hypothetical protein
MRNKYEGKKVKVFLVFLRSDVGSTDDVGYKQYKPSLGYFIKIFHDRFLPYPFLFIMYKPKYYELTVESVP